MNKIIIRSCGERTTPECVKLAIKQGDTLLIHARPFGESIHQTYSRSIEYKHSHKWVSVIDADTLIYPGVIDQAIKELNEVSKQKNIFCLDGKTEDKIFMMARRAGIHIYRIDLLETALQFIDNNHIKPETNIRQQMAKLGYYTHTSKIIFGKHDYEQYYCDLWRKAVCQTQKLSGMITSQPNRWKRLSKIDNDFLVIYNAYQYGIKNKNNLKITIDKECDFNALENITRLGLVEKC